MLSSSDIKNAVENSKANSWGSHNPQLHLIGIGLLAIAEALRANSTQIHSEKVNG